MQEVVVTGGAGAIGSRLVGRLLDLGAARITVVDDLSSGYQWLLPTDPRVRLVVRDIVSGMGDVDVPEPVVFHLAALFANQNSVDHPSDDLSTNGMGTLAVLEWARRQRAKVVVYASAGCSIAGHDVEGPIQESLPPSLHLTTPYQITKMLGELYCNYFTDRYGLPTVRCRFFNSFGPGEVPGRYRNVIPNFIWAALHDRPIVITGSGDETRDFVFVDDLVRALVLATTPTAYGHAINIGTGVETRIRDLAVWIKSACHSSSHIEFAARRAWDKSLRRQAAVGVASDLLGFSAHTTVADGLAQTVRWICDNRARIEGLLPCTS